MAHADTAPASALPAGTLATVNGESISQSQLEDALQASHQRDTPEFRQTLNRDLIARVLLRQNAEKAQYNTKPEVLAAASAAKANAAAQLYVKDNLHPEPVTDAQVKARYDAIVASLGKEEYKSRVITVADDATAGNVLAKLKSGCAFEGLAREYSVAPSKAAGGELPLVSFRTPPTEGKAQGLPLVVAQAMTQLPAGAVTPSAIAVGNERVIVRLDEKRPTQVPAFDRAKDTIRQQLQALALEKASVRFTASLLKDATIQQ
ncbi:peptidyl-prolyl cis-trans isomerase [Paraburkholderia sediminicola]